MRLLIALLFISIAAIYAKNGMWAMAGIFGILAFLNAWLFAVKTEDSIFTLDGDI